MALDYMRLSRKQGRILSLEALAFYAVFRSVTRDLRRSPANCSSGSLKDKVRGSCLSGIGPSHLRDPDIVRDSIRLRLERTLAGVVSDQVRARLIDCFNESNCNSTWPMRPSVFLSSVLDHSFVKLKVKVTEPGFAPDLDVIPTVFEYSPLLQSLELDFFSCSALTPALQDFQAVLANLHILTELKELTISNIPDKFRVDMFDIGESCPQLEVLVLSSVGKSWVDINWGSRIYPNFKVPDCMFKPITLKRLEMKKGMSLRADVLDVVHILSNFPNLEILEITNENVLEAIELLSEGDAADRCQLKLKELPRIQLSDQRMLKAISEMCPSLESICLADESLMDAEILDKLAKLTKVQRVSFEHVDDSNLANVMRLWSNQLTVLEVTGRVEIPLDILATCINLTEFSSHRDIRFQIPPSFDMKQPFLPKLVKVSVNSCLVDYGAEPEIAIEQLLLLSRPSLKHVELVCCHLANTTEGWEKVFGQWRGLESLKIEKASGLDERLIRDLPRWMPKLKDVSLPESLRISRQVQRQLGAQVNLKFYTFEERMKEYFSQRRPRVRKPWDWENGWDTSDDDNFDFSDDGRFYEPECRYEPSSFYLQPGQTGFLTENWG